MSCELGLRFDDPAHVVVTLNEAGRLQTAKAQEFAAPLDAEVQRDLQWYFEVYPVQYTTEIDDERASRIADRIPAWGAALFDAVFKDREAERLFDRFQDGSEEGKLVTVSSDHPAVLAQPWELLRDPKGTFLFLDEPRISVRRQLAGAGGGRAPFDVTPKDRLHLLFVVSRPKDAGFIDPRADPQAVMDAIEAEAPGRVTWEFLRPATVEGLIRRLDDRRLPTVDILHFDGHGAYDWDGTLADRVKQAALAAGVSRLLRDAVGAQTQQGYLLFEKADGTGAPIAAGMLADLLHRKKVGLIVLSACQSATVGGEDPMGSVAARLTHAGLPSILAMTHSVLVDTTRALFGHFYRELARGETVGAALDNTRAQLYAQPERSARQRAEGRIALALQDWFLPALYQPGVDTGLLTGIEVKLPEPAAASDLPRPQESGFYGRRRELWEIERWFAGGTRLVVVNGFGGEGKTYLAQEAGRWLQRAGMFKRVCFVSYAAFQGSDPVGLAVSTLGTTLGESLLDAGAATAALAKTPTLVILDNLEALATEPLKELLDAAVGWSEAGTSRVLITTRSDDLRHPGFPTKESNLCRYLRLQGLGEDDALDWFQALMRLPPEPQVPLPQRDALRNLFAKVGLHPLSVGMLARALKVRRIAELGERLEALLATEKGNPLLASLNLSLERLDPQSALYLPRLGVFQGVAFEDDLIAISELDEAQWQPLRRSLEQTGLIQTESVSGIKPPFLRFHPTLAPALWAKLAAEEQAHLTARYQERYYQVSGFLYTQDSKAAVATVRAIARRELPNLLAAVYGALDAGAPWAIDFADNVNRFLGVFGLSRDRAALSKRAQAAAGEKGSENWYLARSNLGEQLLAAGRFREAEAVFADIVAHLGEAVSYKRCSSLLGLGRSYEIQGRASHAEAIHRQALAEAARLEPTAEVRRLISTFRADLGDVLRKGGQYANARAEYEASLAIKAELGGDDRGVAVVLGQMGALALDENKLDEAESRYRQALETFRRLGEPSSEAVAWHQLGLVYQRANRFQEAEHAYRESARICEGDDDRVAAAGSWGQLAQVMQLAGRPDDAEAWYVKAIKATQAEGDRANEALFLSNLAGLLSDGPGRLGDARSYAEEALVIKKTLDPAAAEIWKTYQILAEIAGKEGNLEAARGYRHEGRASYAVAPVGQETLRRDGDLIRAVVAAVVDPSQRPVLEEAIAGVPEGGRTRLVASLRRILDSERGEDALCEPLDGEDAVIVQAVLRGIADPESLKAIPSAGPAAENAQAADVALRLEKHLPLVRAVVAAINQPELRPQLDAILQQMEQHGWSNLVASIRRILNGEGSADALVGGLDEEDTLIISVILAALEKPDALHDLLDPSPSAQPGA
jgi:tetratricopeptide (TPR) repeat protein